MFRILIIYGMQPVNEQRFQYIILLDGRSDTIYRLDINSEYVSLHYHIENISKSVIFRKLYACQIPSPIKVQRVYVTI